MTGRIAGSATRMPARAAADDDRDDQRRARRHDQQHDDGEPRRVAMAEQQLRDADVPPLGRRLSAGTRLIVG